MSSVTIDGLNSGIDTANIIEGLLEIQQAQLDRTELRRQEILGRQAAFQSLEAQLVAFQSTASSLASTRNNVFDSKSVTVSAPDALLVSAGADATTGNFELTIDSFARAHQVASQGFASDTSEITQGTFTLQQGDRPAVEVTIDGSNNTLQGLTDAINLADSDVQATLIDDGSGTDSFRLLLTSSATGEQNAITLTNSLAATSGDAVQPSFDFGVPVQAAQNAAVRLGSGPGAITIENDTNQLSNVIPGVSLNILQADPDQTITLQIQQDTESAVEAVQGFVDSYNGLTNFINEQTRFVSETEEAGLLLGDRSVIQIQNELQVALQQVIPDLGSSINRISSIGISFTNQGTLTFNSSELISVLNGEVEGASAQDVQRLFTLDGVSSNTGVEFILGSTRTQAPDSPIQVDITQAAERASIVSTNSLSASTIIDSLNSELLFTLDNQPLTVNLSAGTYSNQDLASELQSIINAHPSLGGRSALVGIQADGGGGNLLTLTSETFGESSQIEITGGSALAALGLSGTESDDGVDVDGVFRINGIVEQATGRGRVLSGDRDNPFTDDLQLRVTLTPDQVTSGNESELTLTRGVASTLGQLIGDFQSTESGLLQTVNQRFSQEVEDIDDAIARQEEIFATQEQELREEFVALEQALGELQSTQSFLTQQFAQLNNLGEN
ncbi:MAG: flagellar filament capping protein FliD [Fuerstiella sp.]